MDNLQTNNLIALSLLINEDVYLLDHDRLTVIDDADNETQLIENLKEEILVVKEPSEKYNPKSEETIAPILSNTLIKDEVVKLDYKYLGDNNKYVLIIVNEPNFDFLNKKDLTFLTKILGAKKLEINDVAIINLAKYPSLDFNDLKSFFGFSKLITFGINPKILKVDGSVPNKKFMFKDIAILGTWDLYKLDEDVKKKTTFWNELKTF
ncbi:hypothetical protein A5893_14680 [Pedobacter psychrophilus]|uniref:Uncharacterized protein n=1 Tax=Pedobacter psychrophilus TaxID=1826909 RepID=A0A179DCE6_9SPHI|nr:hypothetical protein [Pedobacter psychrophilus]OAQ38648.1 hypothetical protein A5893_14680 [Pedobacter psychrophilus]